MKPKDLEKRLAKAYEAGYFDGYHEGSEDTHKVWVEESKTVRGIGPKRWSALIVTVVRALQRRSEERDVKKSEEAGEIWTEMHS